MEFECVKSVCDSENQEFFIKNDKPCNVTSFIVIPESKLDRNRVRCDRLQSFPYQPQWGDRPQGRGP